MFGVRKKKQKKLLEDLKVKARLLAGCNHEKAAPILEKLCDLEPDEPRWPLKVGEGYEALGQLDRAVAAYQTAVAKFTEQGFALKAIALGRRIRSIDPSHQQTQDRVAEAYASREPSIVAALPMSPAGPDGIPSFDSLPLHRLPTARRRAAAITGEGAAYLIPLGDEETPAAPLSPDQLPPTPLFSNLDQPALRQLIDQVEVRELVRGDEVYRQGDEGDSLYVLVEGQVGVYRDEVERERLDDGAFFGEIALLARVERGVTVRVLSERCTLLEISQRVIHDLVETHQTVLTELLKFFRKRLVERLVETSELFASFAGTDRDELVQRFSFLEAEPRCSLVATGKQVDGLYVLLSGQADVIWPDAEPSEPLGTGDLFGETSLLTAEPSAFTVRTSTKCWLLKLERELFREVIMTHPQLLATLGELIARRDADGRRGPLRQNVTMV